MKRLRSNKARLDKLCGYLVRSRGRCEINDENSSKYHKSIQVLQWGHILTRSYLQIRWRLDNAFCICKAHHVYYTYRPIEWGAYLVSVLGVQKYEELKRDAQTYKKIDYDKIYDYLKACEETKDLWGKNHRLEL